MQISAETREACLAYKGRQRIVQDTLAPETAGRLADILGIAMSENLHLTWHWAYFNRALTPDQTGHDGHEKLGLFMPPVPFSRRMWAAGCIEMFQPLQLGVTAERVTTIAEVAFKQGRSGPLCFVELEHVVTQNGALALRELQTVVYRDRGLAETASNAADDLVPDGFFVVPDTQLIAYSAVLHNGHRIHWDRDFCRQIEGYPGLVVHGPLLATMLAQSLLPQPARVRFSYRAKAPVFESTPIRVMRSDDNTAWISRSDGTVAMSARLDAL